MPQPADGGRPTSLWGLQVDWLDPADVDDTQLPSGDIVQHLEDDDGWWVTVARQAECHEVRIYDVATAWIDSDVATLRVQPAPGLSSEWLDFQLQLHCLPTLRLLRGDAVFHAGAVVVDGQAILVMGDGQQGKSTTVAMLTNEGAGFLSDDQTGVDPELHAVGSPGLWLRPASAALVPSAAPTRGAAHGRRVVELRPCVESAPVSAVLLLDERAVGDHASIEAVAGASAVTSLLGHTFVAGLVAPDLIARQFEVSARLAADVPVARLGMPSGPPWVPVLEQLRAWIALRGVR